MNNIHELLDDVKRNSQALVTEIETFKQSKILNEAATESLEAMNKALNKTVEAIKPFTEERVKRLSTILLAIGVLNTLLFLVILIAVLSK